MLIFKPRFHTYPWDDPRRKRPPITAEVIAQRELARARAESFNKAKLRKSKRAKLREINYART